MNINFERKLFLKQMGLTAILEQGKQLVQKGFTAQQANDVLQKNYDVKHMRNYVKLIRNCK